MELLNRMEIYLIELGIMFVKSLDIVHGLHDNEHNDEEESIQPRTGKLRGVNVSLIIDFTES